jgi:hypothetical protein
LPSMSDDSAAAADAAPTLAERAAAPVIRLHRQRRRRDSPAAATSPRRTASSTPEVEKRARAVAELSVAAAARPRGLNRAKGSQHRGAFVPCPPPSSASACGFVQLRLSTNPPGCRALGGTTKPPVGGVALFDPPTR